MRKLLVLIAVVMGGAFASTFSHTVATHAGDHEIVIAGADKCYQVRLAKRTMRFHRQEIRTYDANFGIETRTSVLGLSLFCTPVEQQLEIDGSPAGNEPSVPLEDLRTTCYTIRDDVQHRSENIFVRTKLGESVLNVGKAQSICTFAVKASGQLPDFGYLEGRILKCYSARLAKGSPRFHTVRGVLYDQFSKLPKPTSILRPTSFCNVGEKPIACQGLVACVGTGEAAPQVIDLDFNSIVCYTVRQPSFRPFDIPVIDQFIDRQFVDPLVTVRKADSLCVLAAKKDLAPNDDINNATPVQIEYCNLGMGGADCYRDHVGTLSATKARTDPAIPSCAYLNDGFDYGHSVWYTFTPDPEYAHVQIFTYGSSYDTILAVYTGSPGNLTQVACQDDAKFPHDLSSQLDLHLDPYQKYYILVGAKGNDAGGKLKFNVFSLDGGVCSGPTC